MTIDKVYTNYTPYVFVLKNSAGKTEPGYYKAEELTPINPKDIKFVQERVHKRFRRNKKKYKLVKYKNLPE